MEGIYKIVNIKTGDFYIGQSSDINRRFEEHLCLHTGNGRNKSKLHPLSNAIKEFGKDSFKLEILETISDPDVRLKREGELIRELSPKYNIKHTDKAKLSDEMKSYLSQCGKRQWNNMSDIQKEKVVTNQLKGHKIGYVVSESTKQKLRKKNLGKKLSAETKKRISLSNIGKNDNKSHFKKVIALYDNEPIMLFESVKSASEFFNVKSERIVVALKGKRKHFRGYSWKYYKDWSVETNGDECSRVGAISHASKCEASFVEEEIVHSTEMVNPWVNDKGVVQLAMRSGQYKTINVTEVYEGEIVKENRFTGEYEFGERTSDKVVGVMAYFKLTNGFEKYYYMDVDEATAHGKRYSQTFKRNSGLWTTDFLAMAKKTALKLLLSKYGILSIEMQRAQTFDQSVIKTDLTDPDQDVDEAEIEYVDNDPKEARKDAIRDAMKVDSTTGEIFNKEEND